MASRLCSPRRTRHISDLTDDGTREMAWDAFNRLRSVSDGVNAMKQTGSWLKRSEKRARTRRSPLPPLEPSAPLPPPLGPPASLPAFTPHDSTSPDNGAILLAGALLLANASLALDGVNDNIWATTSLPQRSDLFGAGGAFTYSMWFKLPATPAENTSLMRLLWQRQSAGGVTFAYSNNPGWGVRYKVYAYIVRSGYSNLNLIPDITIQDTGWHQAAIGRITLSTLALIIRQFRSSLDRQGPYYHIPN